MVQRRALLGLLVLCAFAGPAFGQTVSFLDAQGSPASVYLEGSRAFLRVEDPAASLNVLVDVSAALTGDAEQVQLTETGPATGVFTGSIQLSLAGPSVDGLLQTSRFTTTSPPAFDTLTATYGAASASASTEGPTVAVLDSSGNEVTSFAVGNTVHFRLRDGFANGGPSVDTIWLEVMATVRSWNEYELVNLTETGGDTSVFEGSVPTVQGIDPVQMDGVVELEPGDLLQARHYYPAWGPYVIAEATAVSDLPVTITFLEWAFDTDRPISEIYEFSYFQIRVTDGAAAGQNTITVRVSSDLRGDEELMTLSEDGDNLGTFYSPYGIAATMSPTPPATDGLLEVTEIPGPPHQFDTVRATPVTCSVSPCPTAVAGVIGSSVRFLDSQGEDAETFSAGDTVTLEVRDYTVSWQTTNGQTTATLVSQSGDSETVSILAYSPYTGLYRGSILCEEGPPVPGDGVLQVHEPDTITASHLDPLGFSSSTDTATVGAVTVVFLDRFGNPADFQFESAWARVQARHPGANLSPGIADTLAATLQTVDVDGNVRDSEPLELTETGPDTDVFTGQMKLSTHYNPQPNDGRLDSWYKLYPQPSIPDDITAIVDTVSATVPLLRSKIWLIDANGADATQYPAGSRIYVRLESEGVNFDPANPDTRFVRLDNLSNGDFQFPFLTETGPDTSIFEGSYTTDLAPPEWDDVLNVQPGHTIRAVDEGGYAPNITDEAVITMPSPPNAVNDSASLAEDGPAISIPVLANDVAAEGLTLSVSAVTQGARGAVAIQGDGTVSYTPNANANGADSFTYTVTDSLGLTDTATVSITISAVNDAPDAVNDSASTNEDVAVTVSVLTNDTDADGDSLTITGVTQGTRGSVSINANSTVTYTPNANANGGDSFTYTVSDGNGGTDTATVTVTISAVNDLPVAVDDTVSVEEEGTILILILANDTDADGDPLTLGAYTPAQHGYVSRGDNNGLIYHPTLDYHGADSFTYTAQDAEGESLPATVTITITPVADAPIAADDAASTSEDTAVTVAVLANDSDGDGDTLTVTGVTQGTRGAATINGDGTVTYTPNANANGSDSFTYTVSDGNGGSDTATVAITINAVNDVPDAVNDSATTNEDVAVTIPVLTNDSDPDDDSLSVASVTQGMRGVAVINANGTITYTPNANANGADSFTYTVSDGNSDSDTAIVSITIASVNDTPDANNDSAATNEDVAATIPVLANDVDLDGETLSITAVTQGTRGSVSINANGTVTYTPNLNTSGADSFTYTVRDAAGATDTATVTLNVAAVNDPPDAVDDTGSGEESNNVAIYVLVNDSDIEGNAISLISVGTPAHGTAQASTINGVPVVIYTPAANFTGVDTFAYTISDGTATDTATLTVTIRDALFRVAVLGTNSVWIQTGADILSGDVVVNQAGTGPFLNGGVELSLAGTVTTPAGWDVQADSVTIGAGSTVASDLYYNQLTNNGTITGPQMSPLTLPVFSSLPTFLTATPGTTDVSVSTNGLRFLSAGSYRDLIVGRKATVYFNGGTYHFRSIRVDREAKLYFSEPSEVRVQQKMSTLATVTVGPSGPSIQAYDILFYVGGSNGTGGGLTETPKAVEIGTDNVLSINLYAPNGTLWIKDRTQATGGFLARNVQIGPDVQVTLQSIWSVP